MKIADWIESNVIDDERALSWFQGEECEPRIVRGYKELLSGYSIDPSTILKTTCLIEPGSHNGVVRVHDISFFSICAHHFLPFFGKVDVTYVPGDRILGLGKFPRLVSALGRRFQIQEHLVKEIGEVVMEHGHARAVRVVSSARHMCMCSRGPSDQSAMTDTSWTAGDAKLLSELSSS